MVRKYLSQQDASAEKTMGLDPIDPEIAKDPTSVSDGEVITLSKREVGELAELQDSRDHTKKAEDSEGTAASLGFIPDFGINVNPWMNVGLSTTLGGTYAAKFPQNSARKEHAKAAAEFEKLSRMAKGNSRGWKFNRQELHERR